MKRDVNLIQPCQVESSLAVLPSYCIDYDVTALQRLPPLMSHKMHICGTSIIERSCVYTDAPMVFSKAPTHGAPMHAV